MASEIYDSEGNYAGYMTADGTVHSSKMTNSIRTAGARMARWNPAESIRIRANRREGRE